MTIRDEIRPDSGAKPHRSKNYPGAEDYGSLDDILQLTNIA